MGHSSDVHGELSCLCVLRLHRTRLVRAVHGGRRWLGRQGCLRTTSRQRSNKRRPPPSPLPSTSRPQVQVLRHALPVAALCSVARGCLLAAGGYDHCVHIWDPLSARCLHVLRGHGETVWSLCARHDGMGLVSGAADNTLRVWCPAEGRSHDHLPGVSGRAKQTSAEDESEAVPLAERPIASMVVALAQRLFSSTLASLNGLASGKAPIEWHDLFGAECTLRSQSCRYSSLARGLQHRSCLLSAAVTISRSGGGGDLGRS